MSTRQSASPSDKNTDPFDFAGWGVSEKISDLGSEPIEMSSLIQADHKLGQWKATAICGNDITSSCLYVSALTVIAAGKYAPLALVIVAAVLYLYRKVYAEVGSALPLNGGTYTVLLNTTNKTVAAGAAVLTILSYIATAVISAGEAMHYAHNLWGGLPVIAATVVLLGLFALLNLIGITESAVVALVIFLFHMSTLTLLTVVVGGAVINDPSILLANLAVEPSAGGIAMALFFGFGAAMLGISGFESSANFIEEQAEGVFPQTLRNMWLAVSIFNPLMCLLALGSIPMDQFGAHTEDLLAHMGLVSAGDAFTIGGVSAGVIVQKWVSVDAVLVLSGAVLTSYVGVTGLIRRMTLDRCLPELLLAKNKWKETNHWIILGFFALCTSILFVTRGDVAVLAGVYTLSFLCVMALFAVGNMLLKIQRSKLPRAVRSSWPGVLTALIAVLVGLIANLEVERVEIFLIYVALATAAIGVMFLRLRILSALLAISKSTVVTVLETIESITSREVIYFTRGDNLPTLNRAVQYVLANEQTRHLKVIHVFAKDEDIPPDLAGHLTTIDHLYPQLRVDFLAVQGVFGPDVIERLSRRLKVPKNYMFIGTPGDAFPHKLAELGGVRLIL